MTCDIDHCAEQEPDRDERIRKVLDDVVSDVAMWIVALELHEDDDIVAQWNDAGYVRLKGLCEQDLHRAIMLLLADTNQWTDRADDILEVAP